MACEDSDTALDALNSALAVPAEVQSDAGMVKQHRLSDLVAAHRYVATQCATTKARRGLRFTRLIPDGTVQRDADS